MSLLGLSSSALSGKSQGAKTSVRISGQNQATGPAFIQADGSKLEGQSSYMLNSTWSRFHQDLGPKSQLEV